MVSLLLLLSCGEADPVEAVALSPSEVLTRISLDTRGVRPSVAELDAVDDNPALIELTLGTYLIDPAFGDRVEDLYQEVLRSRSELYAQDPAFFGEASDERFYASVGDEVLKIISHVATEDMPYTELVTGDWTMADEVLGAMWPLDYPEGAEGWRVAHYTDGRPAAGILSTNGFHWRYDSTLSNANRKRANAVSTIFLCNDFISRPVQFSDDIDVSNPESFDDALRSVDGCKSCHAALDPLGAHLFGFFYHFDENPDDANVYHPERELYWAEVLSVPPGYFGQPTQDTTDLGAHIAQDPDFPGCAVEKVWAGLSQRVVGLDDVATLTTHREAFIEGGLTLRSLWGSVLLDPRYQGAAVDGAVSVKLVSPRQLASQVEALTGYRWTIEGVDAMQSDRVGVRTLAGGLDGKEGARRARGPNPTLLLSQQRLAEAAARHAVLEGGPVLQGMNLAQAPSSSDLQQLERAVLGRSLAEDDDELEALAGLWSSLNTLSGDPREAWIGLLTALLRDPDFLFY